MSVSESVAELRVICQQGPNWQVHQPWAFRQIRKVSIYVTWMLLHTPITPNGVTLMGIVLAIVGGVLFAATEFGLAAIAIVVSMICDFSDGEVSRYRKQQSKQGSFLDKVYHFTAHQSVFAGLAIGAYQLHPSLAVIVLGFVATVAVPAFSIVVGYGNELAVWKHARKLVEKLNTALSATPPNREMLDRLIASGGSARAGVERLDAEEARSKSRAQLVTNLVGYWDFPYIFWVITAAVLGNAILPGGRIGGTSITAFDAVLFFYAVTYPCWIVLYLVHVLATKATERGYAAFSDEMSQLLASAMRVRRVTSSAE
jgi:phosphatidylglycerophosphate synthase